MEVLKNEFKWRRFTLRFHKVEAFGEAQWRWPRAIFVVYRLLMSAYAIFALTYTMVVTNATPRILAFLTIWTYIVETLFFLVGAILATLYTCCPDCFCQNATSPGHRVTLRGYENASFNSQMDAVRDESANGKGANSYGTYSVEMSSSQRSEMVADPGRETGGSIHGRSSSSLNERNQNAGSVYTAIEVTPDSDTYDMSLPWYVQVYWVLANVIQAFALTVTVVYFSALYDPEVQGIALDDLNMHGLNSVMVLIDVAVCARPVRVLHLLYPVIYGVIYIIFSAIYWAQDTKNNVLYPNVLDWNHPGTTVAVVLGLALVGLPLLQLVFFGLYRLRLALYRKVYGKSYL